MAQAFTGAWRRNAYVVGEPDPPELDERHAEHEDQDDVAASIYQAPPQEDAGVAGEYPGADWVTVGGGTVLDTTDYDSHEAGSHNASEGADVRGYYNQRAAAFHDESYTHERYQFGPSSEVNPIALQRGLNGLAVNNPEGFREGFHWPTWAQRGRFPIGERIHDERVVVPDEAYALAAGEGSQPLTEGRYPVAFNSLARAITNVNQRPQARREPPPMFADEVDDGSPIVAAVAGDWVL